MTHFYAAQPGPMFAKDTRSRDLNGSEIFVVDDDEMICETLAVMLESEGCRVTSFVDGDAFLAAARQQPPACILLDVNMPGRTGFDMLRELDAPNYPAPILIVSGQRDVPTAVQAIKGGAIDFIEKPFTGDILVTCVRKTIETWETRAEGKPGDFSRYGLTPRETEVLLQIAGGASNKEAGRHLGISPRTVEVHRARIMDKLGAKNAADLVRIVLSQKSS